MQLKVLKQKETSLTKLLGSDDLPISIGFRLKPLTRAVIQALTDFQESKTKVIEKLGTPTETNGEFNIPKDKTEDFNSEIQALLEVDVELPDASISLKELQNIKLSAVDLVNLDFLIKE